MAINHTHILLLQFDTTLRPYEVEYFRGAIVALLPQDEVLFHNHIGQEDGFRYSYPLIQYKRISGKAVILSLLQGAESVGMLFGRLNTEISLKDRQTTLQLQHVRGYKHLIQTWQTPLSYRISQWIALNTSNYATWQATESMAERILLLERILRGNILSMAKGLGIFFENEVQCTITQISQPTPLRYKGTRLTTFDAEFTCNVSLPPYIGLGKGVSIGYGMVTTHRMHRKPRTENNT